MKMRFQTDPETDTLLQSCGGNRAKLNWVINECIRLGPRRRGRRYSGDCRAKIEAAFQADPLRHHHDIARELNCSPCYAGYVLQVLRLRTFGPPAQDVNVVAHDSLKQVFRATRTYLAILSARVAEAKELMPASEFVRWLLFSGVDKLCLPEDGRELRRLAGELKSSVNERFRTNNTEPKMEALQLQSLNEKLDALAAKLNTL